ncbi:MAG: caspase family protein [Xanthobacteraceae bacterium]
MPIEPPRQFCIAKPHCCDPLPSARLTTSDGGHIMTLRFHSVIAAAVFALCSASSAAWAEARLALVIGNSAYQAVPPLPNPANDARAMAGFLTGAGFDVTAAPDLAQTDMRKAIADFAAKVARAGSDTVALVYYAGHGVQIDGENFLVPVDARVQRESDVPLQAIRLADVMNTLSSVPSRMRIVMLDACRNNPFSEINKTAGHGLAIVDAPVGSIVSYSTSPGSEAEDGTGADSPYTTALLNVGKEPGLPIEQTFKRARLSVNQATAGRQTPWESSSLSSDFSFFPGGAATPAKPPEAQKAQPLQAAAKTTDVWKRELRSVPAQRAYEIVVSEDKVEAYEAYISLFGAPPLGPRVRGLLDRRNEMIAWYIAVTANNPVSLQAFLTKYGSSDFAATASRLLERARSRSLMASVPPAGPTQVANASPATPACSCSQPTNKGPRRAGGPPMEPIYYPAPVQRAPAGPPVQIDIGIGGRGGFGGGRPPGMNSPPMNNSPMHGDKPSYGPYR